MKKKTKTKKICDEILTRFGDGEFLKYICTGKEEYPNQATFWRWRQKDRELAQRFMSALAQNVTALLEKSELLIEAAASLTVRNVTGICSTQPSRPSEMICPKCYGTGRITLPHIVNYKVESRCNYDGCVNGIVHCCDGVQAQSEEKELTNDGTTR